MRKFTGPWLVMITATLIFVPLIAYASDVQGSATASPTGARGNSRDLPPAMSARAAESPFHAAPLPGDHGTMARRDAPSSLLTLPQATIDLPGKQETFIRSARCPDMQVPDDCRSLPRSEIETPFCGNLLLIDARLRHRGPPSSPAAL